MNVNKPLGGKSVGVYNLMPEEEYKKYLSLARKQGMNVEEYFMYIVRKFHEQTPG